MDFAKDWIMGRCQYCPSNQIRSVHFHPIDFVLVFAGVRRYRCEFCHEVQSRWLLPRPLRWALGVALIGVLYIASPGPVDWLHASGRLSDSGYARLERSVFKPIGKFTGRAGAAECPVTNAFNRYRDWWTAGYDDTRAAVIATPTRSLTDLDDLIPE